MRKRSVSTEKVVLTAKPCLHSDASKSTKATKKHSASVCLVGLSGLVESEGAFVIAERTSLLAEVERQRRKGGSDGKAMLCIQMQASPQKATKKHSASVCLVGLSGLEPPTPTLSGWCSNLLSYNPIWCGGDTRIRRIAKRICLHIEASVSEDLSSVYTRKGALRPQRNAGIFTYGGDTRIRTEDLLNANQALYQLSYIPT